MKVKFAIMDKTNLKVRFHVCFDVRDAFIGALMYCKISLFSKSKQWHLVKYIIWFGSTCDCWLAGRARNIYRWGIEIWRVGLWLKGGGYLDLKIVCIHHP